MRALKFGAVGIANTGLDVALFAALTLLAGIPAPVANIASYSAGIGLSFVLNRAWTFRDRRGGRVPVQLTMFALGNFIALALSTATVALLAGHWGPLPAKAVSVLVTFAWNYVFATFVVWR